MLNAKKMTIENLIIGSGGESEKLLEPMDIARCKMGTWINPFFDSYLNEVIGDKSLSANQNGMI